MWEAGNRWCLGCDIQGRRRHAAKNTSPGSDLVGAVLTILIEAALITPLVGLNLYVFQGMRQRGSINDVIRGSRRFLIGMVALITLLMTWSDIALWLPRYFMGEMWLR
jgi:TRAP-type C4-dicarboxylate transport system permease large subunit